MCNQPLFIKNKKLSSGTFLYGVDKKGFYVPCGHCAQCRSKKVNDMVVRGYHEYLDTELKHGFTIFNTLTYSEINVPRLMGMRVLSKRDIQLFNKRLRISLERDGYEVDGHLKYIITSEYGEEGTHRGHYHTLHFVTIPNISPSIFDAYVHRAWKTLKFDSSKDVIGFQDNRPVNERVVNSIFGIRYVCKYIGKGSCVRDAIMSYDDKCEFKVHFIKWCAENKLNPYSVEDWQLSHFWRILKEEYHFSDDFNLLTFCLQSHSIGLSFLSDTNFDNLLDKILVVCKSPKGYKEFSVPLYYIRKVFYRYDKDSKRFILNNDGKKYLDSKNKLIIDELNNLYNISNTIIDTITSTCTEAEYSSFRDLCDTILCGRSFTDFVYYDVFLKDINISPVFEFLDLPNIDAKTLASLVSEYSLDCHIKDSLDYTLLKKCDLFNSTEIQFTIPNHQMTFNQLPQFKDYDLLSHYINKINNVLSHSLNEQLQINFTKEKERIKALSTISNRESVIF